jgi:hypothetical protein
MVGFELNFQHALNASSVCRVRVSKKAKSDGGVILKSLQSGNSSAYEHSD